MPGVIGYKVWVPDTTKPKLNSTAAPYTWKPGGNIAKCARNAKKKCMDGLCEVYGSHCGFWAYDSPESAYSRGHGEAKNVLGVVLGYGKVILGEFGWRAEKAKIIALAQGWRTDLEGLAEAYKVPLMPINKLDWIIEQHNGVLLKDVPEEWRTKKIECPDVPSYFGQFSGLQQYLTGGYILPSSTTLTNISSSYPTYYHSIYSTTTTTVPVGNATVTIQRGATNTVQIQCGCGFSTMWYLSIMDSNATFDCSSCQKQYTGKELGL